MALLKAHIQCTSLPIKAGKLNFSACFGQSIKKDANILWVTVTQLWPGAHAFLVSKCLLFVWGGGWLDKLSHVI
jgi:hypothetical protein